MFVIYIYNDKNCIKYKIVNKKEKKKKRVFNINFIMYTFKCCLFKFN